MTALVFSFRHSRKENSCWQTSHYFTGHVTVLKVHLDTNSRQHTGWHSNWWT